MLTLNVPTSTPEPGIYDMTRADYDFIDAVNQTALKACLFKSPAHYIGGLTYPKPPTDEMLFGQAFDILLLEGRKALDDRFVFWDGLVRRGKVWEAFFANAIAQGKQIIRQEGTHSLELAEAMVHSVLCHPAASDLLKRGGDTQCVLIWRDEPTGLLCKGMADRYVDDQWPSIPDVKTTVDASPDGFARAIVNFGYHLQGAFYIDGAVQLRAEGATQPNYPLIAVEKAPIEPGMHPVAVYPLGPKSLNRGRMLYREGLEIYKHCKETNDWPCYSDEPQELELPGWALR